MKLPLRLLLPALLFAFVADYATAADAAPRYNQIHFQVERSRPVDNDRMQAMLSITAEDDNAARLADQVNRTMDWALKTAKGKPGVEIHSGGYRTYPTYDRNKVRRWHATQELTLESADFAELGTLIGQLQERLPVHPREQPGACSGTNQKPVRGHSSQPIGRDEPRVLPIETPLVE